MKITITNTSEPNENGLVTINGTYIPDGYTCGCKSKSFQYELLPNQANKSTIEYLIRKDELQ